MHNSTDGCECLQLAHSGINALKFLTTALAEFQTVTHSVRNYSRPSSVTLLFPRTAPWRVHPEGVNRPKLTMKRTLFIVLQTSIKNVCRHGSSRITNILHPSHLAPIQAILLFVHAVPVGFPSPLDDYVEDRLDLK